MFRQACHEWELVLGPENVITADASLRAASSATFATAQQVPAILRPGTREEVQNSLRIATRFKISVYPVSSGKNWGYGSSVPPVDGCVLLDLSRMRRVIELNEELAYVTVEPGVTQGQLFEYLRQKNSRLWVDPTGSSPDCSLIGNTIERGFGHTPYGDHSANVCAFEVVLPNGEILETGSSRFADAHAAPVYRWGLGPSLDGLFTQANFGVVTRMTLWLMPAPEHFQAFFFKCDREDGLPAIVEALRPLRMNGTLRSSIHLGNDYKVLAGIQQYPWDEPAPLSSKQMERFRKRMNFGAWNGSGGLYGTRAQVKEARRLVHRALAGKVDKIQFLDDRLLRLASRFARPFHLVTGWDLSKALTLVKPLYGLMKGIPTNRPLASVYWRKRTAPPAQMNPDHDGCGLLWCAPVAPAQGRHAKILADVCSQILMQHGFEPQLSFTLITDRALICVASITYDREVPGEDQRARVCHDELQEKLMAAGYISYRLGIQSMGQMDCGGAYGNLLNAIKRHLDPSAILAPGRYSATELASEPDEAIALFGR